MMVNKIDDKLIRLGITVTKLYKAQAMNQFNNSWEFPNEFELKRAFDIALSFLNGYALNIRAIKMHNEENKAKYFLSIE